MSSAKYTTLLNVPDDKSRQGTPPKKSGVTSRAATFGNPPKSDKKSLLPGNNQQENDRDLSPVSY